MQTGEQLTRDTLEFGVGIILGGLLTAALPSLLDVHTESDPDLKSKGLGLWIVAIILVALAIVWRDSES